MRQRKSLENSPDLGAVRLERAARQQALAERRCVLHDRYRGFVVLHIAQHEVSERRHVHMLAMLRIGKHRQIANEADFAAVAKDCDGASFARVYGAYDGHEVRVSVSLISTKPHTEHSRRSRMYMPTTIGSPYGTRFTLLVAVNLPRSISCHFPQRWNICITARSGRRQALLVQSTPLVSWRPILASALGVLRASAPCLGRSPSGIFGRAEKSRCQTPSCSSLCHAQASSNERLGRVLAPRSAGNPSRRLPDANPHCETSAV